MPELYLQGLTKDDLESLIRETVEAVLTKHLSPTKPENRFSTNYLSRKETATILRISLPTLSKWTYEGKIKAYRIGTRIRYKPDEVHNALEKVSTLKYKRT